MVKQDELEGFAIGFTYRKYHVNEGFFKTWSREMAYVLGFVLADGCVRSSTRRKGPVLNLSSTDLDILETVATLMESTHKIRQLRNRRGSWYALNIYSKAIVDDLIALGIGPAKSRSVVMPNVTEAFVHDFIRGFFDGDGSVYAVKRKGSSIPGIQVEFATGSPVFQEQLALLLNHHLGAPAFNFAMRKNNTGVGIVRTFNLGSQALFHFMYDRGGPCLRRKFEKFSNLMESRKDIAYRLDTTKRGNHRRPRVDWKVAWQEVHRLRAGGMTYARIAASIGVTLSYLHKKIRRMGQLPAAIAGKPRYRPPIDWHVLWPQVEVERQAGKTYDQVAQSLGISRAVIFKQANRIKSRGDQR